MTDDELNELQRKCDANKWYGGGYHTTTEFGAIERLIAEVRSLRERLEFHKHDLTIVDIKRILAERDRLAADNAELRNDFHNACDVGRRIEADNANLRAQLETTKSQMVRLVLATEGLAGPCVLHRSDCGRYRDSDAAPGATESEGER